MRDVASSGSDASLAVATVVDDAVNDWLEFSSVTGDRTTRVVAHLGRQVADACAEFMRAAALLGIYQWKLITTGQLEPARIAETVDVQLQALRRLHAPWLLPTSVDAREDRATGTPDAAAAE